MDADLLILNATQLLTCASPDGPKRGAALADAGETVALRQQVDDPTDPGTGIAPGLHAGKVVADAILELDGFNPQVAARLIDPLGRWRRYDAGRQELMKEELARIRAQPGLSNDLVEKVTKSLEG